ncbi:MAG: MBL fold metallo-hydrolase [Ruminococcaceae bacterium]|nr:MBL fold metallo-hydrolase [Oscillospiraceae bacterium]
MRRKQIRDMRKLMIIIIVVVVSIISYAVQRVANTPKGIEDSEFTVYYIDVGQGNAAYIDNGDKDILIDAGTAGSGDVLVNYLDILGVEHLEYFFVTHPHEDHIGGAAKVIDNFDIEHIITTEADSDSYCYEDMIDAIDREYIKFSYASSGDIYDIGGATVNVLSPAEGEYYDEDELNLSSLVLRVTYKDTCFVFAGDAEKKNEKYILENYDAKELKCDVLCVGHHGSNTSSGEKFLDALDPDICVISVGAGNDYGHPHSETMVRLYDRTDKIYRTDRHGNIIICSNGKRVWAAEQNEK